jgi:hypothetical protein
MKIKEKTQKTYLNYLESYNKWCGKQNSKREDPQSLTSFRKKLEDFGRSSRYIKQCVNVIRRHYGFSPEKTVQRRGENVPFTEEEISILFKFAEYNYQRDELSLVLYLMMKYDMNLARIKKLTRFKIRQLVLRSNEETVVLDYVLASTFDLAEEEIVFRKNFSTYSTNFKQRQKRLFPDKSVRNFSDLKRRRVNYFEFQRTGK